MSKFLATNIYQNYHCCKCGKFAVGVVSREDWRRYYCDYHLRLVENYVNKEQTLQEQKQWGDKDFYQEVFGKPKPTQQKLI